MVGCLSEIKWAHDTQTTTKTRPTWNGVTVKTLYFVLCCRGVVQQFLNAFCACEWVAIPSDRRRRAIEFGKVYCPRWGVVGGIIQAGELVCGACRDFDALGVSVEECGVDQTYSYSSRVRVVILREFRGSSPEPYLLEGERAIVRCQEVAPPRCSLRLSRQESNYSCCKRSVNTCTSYNSLPPQFHAQDG